MPTLLIAGHLQAISLFEIASPLEHFCSAVIGWYSMAVIGAF